MGSFRTGTLKCWLQVANRFAADKGLPTWSHFRIVPVDNQIQRIDDEEDDAYSFAWVAGGQYWWTNVCDPAKDLVTGNGCEVTMVHPSCQVDSMAVERRAGVAGISERWRTLCQILNRLAITLIEGSAGTIHWTIPPTYVEDLNITVIFPSERFQGRSGIPPRF
jgi:hypothetical protein